MSTMVSTQQNGKKLSFADWISNLSPTETPFTSMIGSESIDQVLFQWQVDELEKTNKNNNEIEGSVAEGQQLRPTKTIDNVTQIFRKVAKVSDTAAITHNYGRKGELIYQLEKKGKEIKRDIEYILLSEQDKDVGAGDKPRTTAAFQSLVSKVPDADTGAVVYTEDELNEDSIFKTTYNLYLAGSCADTIMYHPKHAKTFSGLMETTDKRFRMFDGSSDTKVNVYVSHLVDPLGRLYKLIPNRFMPEDAVYFFNSKCWTKMVLRPVYREKLAKDGSYEKWMIETELGLRHTNPFESGVIKITSGGGETKLKLDKTSANIGVDGGTKGKLVNASSGYEVITATHDSDKTVTAISSDESVAIVAKNSRQTRSPLTTKYTITAMGKGSTEVSFTDGEDTIKVSVTVSSSSISVEAIPKLYPTDTYTAKAVDAVGTVEWFSTDEGAFSVNKDSGLITALVARDKPVRAIEIVGGINFYGETEVDIDDVVITLSPSPVEVNVGESVEVTATVTPPRAAEKPITWESGDTNVFTVTGSGKTGTVVGVAVGSNTMAVESAASREAVMVAVEVK